MKAYFGSCDFLKHIIYNTKQRTSIYNNFAQNFWYFSRGFGVKSIIPWTEWMTCKFIRGD